METEREVVAAATSADGKKRWRFQRRSDGFFVYNEDTFYSEDLSEFGGGLIEYWTPTGFSGLFDTAEAAQLDALSELPPPTWGMTAFHP